LALIIFGISIVAFVTTGQQETISDQNSTENETSLTGIIFLLLSQIFLAAKNIVEEKFLIHYPIDTAYMNGIQGCWGCLLIPFILLLFHFI